MGVDDRLLPGIIFFIDVLSNRNKYTSKIIKSTLRKAIMDTNINMIITIIHFMIFKRIVFKFAYEEVS